MEVNHMHIPPGRLTLTKELPKLGDSGKEKHTSCSDSMPTKTTAGALWNKNNVRSIMEQKQRTLNNKENKVQNSTAKENIVQI